MRILFVTQWFDPEPAFKGLLFASALAKRGHEVQVLTGFPNYPGGRLYPGYRIKPLARETLQGVDVIRVPLYPSHDRSVVRRVLNYGSFSLSAALLGSLCVRPAHVAYVYHPPVTTGFAAMVLRALRGIPFVADIQDLWPDTLAATGMLNRPGLLKWIDRCCRQFYRAARKIVVLSPGFKSALAARGVPADKVEVIYNWCDAQSLQSSPAALPPAEEALLRGKFNIVFAGNMGPAQALQAVIRAAEILVRRLPEVQFIFVGSGLERDPLEAQARDLHLTNVHFLPRRPVAEIGAVLARADALLVHLKDDPLFRITIPSKTQAYLAAGKPLLMAVRGDSADLVAAARAGAICEPANPEAIAAGAEDLFRMAPEARAQLGANGRRFYDETLSLEAGVSKFEAVFRSAALASH